MADVTITYKGAAIATMDASGSKILETAGKYCEGNIDVVYVKPSGGGSGIKKATYQYTPTSTSYVHTISINEDVAKILFVHFYDTEAEYPTNNTTYEGSKIGPALAHYAAVSSSYQWQFWRTNSSGSTSYNSYGNSGVFNTPGEITLQSNPQLKSGHIINIDVFYED